ncbi:MAG: hypothetical protein LBJ96_05690, partial [Holosporaceae bacterium]|nr:hypothetical protein [Holosporaceae bacterium]
MKIISGKTSELEEAIRNDLRERSQLRKELYIRRTLSSPLIKTEEVMSYYISEVVEKISKKGKTVVLMMDQSQIHEDRQCLMISLRFEERAIPILWR